METLIVGGTVYLAIGAMFLGGLLAIVPEEEYNAGVLTASSLWPITLLVAFGYLIVRAVNQRVVNGQSYDDDINKAVNKLIVNEYTQSNEYEKERV